MLFLRQDDGDRDDLLLLLAEGFFQQRMAGPAELEGPVLREDGHAGDDLEGDSRLGHQEIQLPDEGGSHHQVRDIGTEEFREGEEDPGDLPRFGEMQFADFVVQFDDFRRLDEGRLAGSGFVVDKARQEALLRGDDRDEHLAVADGYAGVGIHKPILLRFPEDGVDALGDGGLLLADIPADVEKGVGGAVLDLAVFVEDEFDAALDFRESHDPGGRMLEMGIDPVLDGTEEVRDFPDRLQQGAELAEGEEVDRGVVADGLEEGDAVDVAAGGESVLEHQDQAHLVGEDQAFPDVPGVGREGLVRDPLRRVVGRTAVRDAPADPVEAQFLLQSLVRHGLIRAPLPA